MARPGRGAPGHRRRAHPSVTGAQPVRRRPSGRGLPVHLLLAAPGAAAPLVSRRRCGTGRTRRSGPAGGSTGWSAGPTEARRRRGRRRRLRRAARRAPAVRRAAACRPPPPPRPVRLLRPARVGDGVPAGRRQRRHPGWPLRLGPGRHRRGGRARTRSGAPTTTRSASSPRRRGRATCCSRISDSRRTMEQPGCLHASMDLYKWAYKLRPAGAERPAARRVPCWPARSGSWTCGRRRTTWPSSGYPPVRIETADGKAEYVAAQRGFARPRRRCCGAAARDDRRPRCSPRRSASVRLIRRPAAVLQVQRAADHHERADRAR